jgi:four helix bundle protein
MRNYESLEVFQRSDRIAINIYQVTKQFPKEELFGITSQLRRAALSIPNNIVEGYVRNTTKEFMQFLNISKGSAAETKYLVNFSAKLGYITSQVAASMADELDIIIRMLTKLIKSLAPST